MFYGSLKKGAFVKRPKETWGGGDPLEVVGARPIPPLYRPKHFFDLFFHRFGTPLYWPKHCVDVSVCKESDAEANLGSEKRAISHA